MDAYSPPFKLRAVKKSPQVRSDLVAPESARLSGFEGFRRWGDTTS
jgi:hypothetical protein